MKRISALVWIVLVGFLSVVLYADNLPGSSIPVSSNHEVQASSQDNELSWPRGELLVGSVRWMNSKGTAKKCLVVSQDDPQGPADTRYLYTIDLPGERFVAIMVPPDGAIAAMNWHFDETLKRAGYSPQLFIPEQHVFLNGRQVDKPVWLTVKGYVKRAGNDIRLIVISWSADLGSQTASGSRGSSPSSMAVFVSNVTPLDQVFKEKRP